MKNLISLIFILTCGGSSFAQNPQKFKVIDARAKTIGYYPLVELTQKLVKPYTDDEDKARAIFAWIAHHISYDYKEFKHRDSLRYNTQKYAHVYDQNTFDSLWNIEYANFALKYHRGICGEYSALFKAMCDVAGLQCEIVEGYGKWPENIGKPYQSTHAWNAVFINNKWQLLDVTWAYGGIDLRTEGLIKDYNPFYFFTPPELFLNNHYPDKIKWTLLPDVKTSRAQFENAIYYDYDENGAIKVENVVPKNGLIKKKVGDSVSFEITTKTECEHIGLAVNDTVEVIDYIAIPSSNKQPNILKTPPISKSSKVVKSKPVSAKEAKTIDALFDYVDTVTVDSTVFFTAKGPDLKHAANDGALSVMEENFRYFKKEGQKYSFKYYVKKKGDYLIWISMNDENLMAYRLVVE